MIILVLENVFNTFHYHNRFFILNDFLVFGDISLTIFIALKQFSTIILSVESNPRLFGFCFTSLCDWF